ncbi:hypothetical protein ES703_01589 [subsurface metagenome]
MSLGDAKFEVAEFCHRCRHLHPRKPTELDPWRYRCGVPFTTLTIARDSGRCKYFKPRSSSRDGKDESSRGDAVE